MNAKDKLDAKLADQQRENDQSQRWAGLFGRLMVIWLLIAAGLFYVFQEHIQVGVAAALFAAGTGLVVALSLWSSNRPAR